MSRQASRAFFIYCRFRLLGRVRKSRPNRVPFSKFESVLEGLLPARGPALQLGTHLCGQQLEGSGSRASSGRLISAGANLSSQNQRKRRRSHAADNWGVGPRSPFLHCAGMASRGANMALLHFVKENHKISDASQRDQ